MIRTSLRVAALPLVLFAASCSGAPAGPVPPGASASPSASGSAAALPFTIPAATNPRLPEGVTPLEYSLSFTIDPDKARFSGHTVIAARVDIPTRMIVMHGRDLTVERAVVRVEGKELSAEVHSRKAFGQREGEDEIVLLLQEKIGKGPATIDISYDAPFGTLWGLYRIESEGRHYAFTQLEAIEGRRMFPSFDEPRFKTPFAISIDAPTAMKAVSNGKMSKSEAHGETTHFEFAKTEPLPTYLVAVAVGDLDIANGATGVPPVRLVAAHGKSAAGMASTKVASDSLSALAHYFDIPYPFGKLDIVAVPEFAVGAMENAGLVTFRDELLLTDDGAPASARRRQRYVVAHELAHQWFGDLVTMKWWDDLWLNEGFATWMQSKACDAAFPGFGAVEERVLDKNVALNADVLPSAKAVRSKVEKSDEIRDAGGWSAYQKGSSVLTMLEAWLGEAEFRTAIASYVTAHAKGTVTSNDLFSALDNATGQPVSLVASSFLDEPGVPLITVDLSCSHAKLSPAAELHISESELSSTGEKTPSHPWAAPVCMRLEGEKKPRCVMLDPDHLSDTVLLNTCPKWAHPNANETGYYRYRMSSERMMELAEHHKELTASERAGLIVDAWALAQTGMIHAADVASLLSKMDLGKETSRVVLQATVDVLTDMKRELVDASLPSDKATREAFARMVHRILDPQKKRVGLPKTRAAESDDLRLARVLVLGGLFDLTDEASVASDLEPFAAKYLADPASVDADLGTLAIRVSARAGGAAGTSLDGARLKKVTRPTERVALVVALSSRKDPKALTEALELFDQGVIRPGDIRYLKNGALRSSDTVPTFHAWMRAHFDTIVKQLGGGGGSLTASLGRVCDEAELNQLRAFLEPRLPSLEGAQRGFDEGLADAQRCIAIRQRESQSFAAALRALQ